MRRKLPLAIVGGLILAIVATALLVSGRSIVNAAPGDVTADRVFGQGGSFTQTACNNGGISANSLCQASGVAVDTLGHVYVADMYNHRVLGFIDPINTDTTADLVIGQGGSFTSGVPALGGVTASSLDNPTDVAVDSAGNLYVVDWGHDRVLEYDTPFSSNTVADRVFGQFNSMTTAIYNNGGTSANSLKNPMSVAVDPAGNLYIGDRGNRRILQYNTPLSSDTTADRVFGQLGSFTTSGFNQGGLSANSLSEIVGIGVDTLGNLYVADQVNERVLKYNTPLSSDTTADKVFGQLGSFTSGIPDNGGVNADSLESPTDVEVDNVGNVYITETGNERSLSYDDPVSLDTGADVVYGQGGSMSAFGNNNGGVSANSQGDPWELAFDLTCNLYIIDYGNNRLLEYDSPPHACIDAPSPTPTATQCTPTCTPTPSNTPTETPTVTPTFDPCSPGPTCTPTAVPTSCIPPPPCSPTDTPTPTPSDTSTATPTNTETPSATPSPTNTVPVPTLTVIAVYLDCNIALAGVQTNCSVVVGSDVDVGIVLANEGNVPTGIGALTFEVHNSNRAKAVPVNGTDGNLNANPDFNELVAPGEWRCSPPPPVPDSGEDGPTKSVSHAFCIQDHDGRIETAPLEPDAAVTFATVHLHIPAGASSGDAVLSLEDVTVRDAAGFIEIASCAPAMAVPATCGSATLHLASGCGSDNDCDAFFDPQQLLHLGPANTQSGFDSCPLSTNPTQLNTDGNFLDHSPPFMMAVDDKTLPGSDAAGDACDTDDDNDGISDTDEATGLLCASFITHPLLRDTDADRFLDGAECALGTDPTLFASKPLVTACGATTDMDGDKLTERVEFCFYGTDPGNSDTDGDKALDGAKDGCEAASLNGDHIVNVADMGMLATAISNAAFRVVSVDVNKDGVWNPADQGLLASFISPSGQCPG